MYIYKITNIINNKVYVGKCSRSQEKTKNYYGGGIIIKKAVKAYGKHNFIKDVLCECNDIYELNNKEAEFIELLNATDRKYGYNVLHSGIAGTRFGGLTFDEFYGDERSKELKLKFSKGAKGKPKSQEHKNIISATHKNKIVSSETRLKMSKSSLGKKKRRTVEHQEKIFNHMKQLNEKRKRKFDTSIINKIYELNSQNIKISQIRDILNVDQLTCKVIKRIIREQNI